MCSGLKANDESISSISVTGITGPTPKVAKFGTERALRLRKLLKYFEHWITFTYTDIF